MNQIQNEADQWSSSADYILSQSTQESDRKEYDWSLLTDFLIHNHPPYAVAEGLLACYFQLTDYLVKDEEGDNINRKKLDDGLYILRSLFELLQAMEEEAGIIPRERGTGIASRLAFPKEKKEKKETKQELEVALEDLRELSEDEKLQERIRLMRKLIDLQENVITKQDDMIEMLKDKVGFVVASTHMVCHSGKKAVKISDRSDKPDKPVEKKAN